MKAVLYPRLLEQLVRGRNGHSGVYLEKAYMSSALPVSERPKKCASQSGSC